MSFWSSGFWADGFWSADFWIGDTQEPAFLPYQIGYGRINIKPKRRPATLREATAAIFGPDWDKDPAKAPIVAQRAANTTDVERKTSERNPTAMRTHNERIKRPQYIEPFDPTAVKRILDQARNNAAIARELELERQDAEMLMLMMMEM